ncbi:GNAT family N-acetyltransferase [Lacticaseibacillus zhaodongensis]|uniref:GNAT family N-acetyltransferase n=1 Tax=Lacticaseibacillus zhaodongensis TaxID=2668065 RepID=UPI0012D35C1D|nr:GNAT family protein [Lacticaseibacillus zhaodongensis]
MTIELLPARPKLAAELYAVVAGSRDYINKWLPWAEDTQSVADEEHFLQHMEEQAVARKTYMFAIRADGTVVGAIDLHNIDAANHHAEMGYFLGEEATGKGIIHQALGQIERFGFGELALNKITILAATANQPSRHVAERAHYHLDGILRAELLLHNKYIDCAVYSKLATEA